MRSFGPIIAASSLIFSVSAQAATVKEWRTDLASITRTLESKHPDPFTKLSRANYDRRIKSLMSRLPQLSEEKRTVEAMRIIAAIGDGHTQLEPIGKEYSRWYPFRPYEFTDGYFITSAYKDLADLAGAKILTIGGLPVEKAIDRARDLMGADNVFYRKENVFAITNAALAKGLGLTDSQGRLPISVILPDGRTVNRQIAAVAGDSSFDWRFRSEVFGPYNIGQSEDWITAYKRLAAAAYRTSDHNRPPHFDRRYFYVSRPIDKDNYYMDVNFTQDGPDDHFIDFFKQSLSEVDRLKPKNLIVDWRYNNGGNGDMVTAMIHQFIKREDNPPWTNLYVLVGRKSFSAAIQAIGAFRDHVPATFVGEPAGAALNSFGDPDEVPFDKTQLRLSVSTVIHQLSKSNDHSRFVPIDVPAQFSFADYAAGRDPAVDAIVGGDEMRALKIIALQDGGAAARAAYQKRRNLYGNMDWWTPASEDDLNRAGYTLLRAHRVSDAVEVFALNTEIFPNSWRAWDSLGEAELAAGMKDKGMASYRKSLALNAGNENARMVLQSKH